MKVLFTALAVLLTFATSNIVNAEVKETVESINGFKVRFVDIGRGDSFAVTFYTPHGTLHDKGLMMGRAHLLEHVLFTGTQAFPGYHTYDEILKPAGVDHNAYTADAETFYHAMGPATQAELILRTQLAMLGGLEWNPEVFVKERAVVINEIAQENNKKDAYASRYMALTKLLPPDHPWAYPRLGDDANLSAMTIPDVQEAYARNYTPRDVTVAIVGNFSDPAFLAKVKAWTSASLHTFHLATPPPPTPPVPSMFSTREGAPESARQLYMHSNTLRAGSVLMEADLDEDNLNPAALELLTAYLSLPVPGSLHHRLTTELAWTTDVGFFPIVVGSKVHFYFGYDLTAQGAAHGQEIREMMITALKSVHNIDPVVLDLLKEKQILEWERAGRSVSSLMRPYTQALERQMSMQELAQDLRAVQPAEVEHAAAAFRPDRALYEEMGPDELPGMTEDPVFSRRFVVRDGGADLARSMAVYQAPAREEVRPKLSVVDLGEPDHSPTIPAWFQSPGDPWFTPNRLVMDLRRDLPDNAVQVVFKTAPRDAADLVALDLKVLAFNERFNGELAYLNLKYQISLSIKRALSEVEFSASGEDAYSVEGLRWLMEKFAEFQPSAEELGRARERYMEERKGKYSSSFSALIGFEELQHAMDPYSLATADQYEIAKHLDLSQVAATSARLLSHSNRETLIIGDLQATASEKLKAAALRVSPEYLSASEAQGVRSRFSRVPETSTEIGRAFALPKGDTSYARLRAYSGPLVTDFDESVAFMVFNSALASRVTHHNRGDHGLGYIHTTVTKSLDSERHHLTFLGQTDGAANAKQTVQGWEDVLAMFQRGDVTDSELQDAITGVRNELAQQNTSADQYLTEYRRYGSLRRDARSKAKLLEILDRVTPEQVRAVANKYLFNEPKPPYLQLTLGDCARLLESGG